jgi:hypothetical protein
MRARRAPVTRWIVHYGGELVGRPHQAAGDSRMTPLPSSLCKHLNLALGGYMVRTGGWPGDIWSDNAEVGGSIPPPVTRSFCDLTCGVPSAGSRTSLGSRATLSSRNW